MGQDVLNNERIMRNEWSRRWEAAYKTLNKEGIREQDLPASYRHTVDPHPFLNEAFALATAFDTDLGSLKNKPSQKRVVFTHERVREAFPGYEMEYRSPLIKRSNYIRFKEMNDALIPYDEADEAVEAREFSRGLSTKFLTSVRLFSTAKQSETRQIVQVSVYYYATEKNAKIDMCLIPIANTMGASAMIEMGLLRPCTELNIGETCIIRQIESKEKTDVVAAVYFVRDCTLFVVEGWREDSNITNQNNWLLETAKLLDEYYIDANKELNRIKDSE